MFLGAYFKSAYLAKYESVSGSYVRSARKNCVFLKNSLVGAMRLSAESENFPVREPLSDYKN